MFARLILLFWAWSLSFVGYAQPFVPLPDSAIQKGDTPQLIALGKQLFFDPRLSATGTVSCNTCHNLMGNGADGLPLAIGVLGRQGQRSSPTVWNAAFFNSQFWDGRAATLEEQAKGPILNPVEMAMPSEQAVVTRLSAIAGYRQQFNQLFQDGVTYNNIATAIAAYERTLITPNSPFDRFLKGEEGAISQQAKTGMRLVEELGCTGCHNGILFAGPTRPNGLGSFQLFPTFLNNPYVNRYRLIDDIGRYAVTKDPADRYVWRVPTWRNIALTAPYFHNGSVNTLEEAIRVMAATQLDKRLRPEEVESIAAFLHSLTGEFPQQSLPRLPMLVGESLL